MHKICFYVPKTHKELVKNALFTAGAGKIGDYDHCCWEIEGTGQYRPLENSSPTLGTHNEINTVSEYKIEMVCSDALLQNALKALIDSHPYEEPAYSAWPIIVATPHE